MLICGISNEATPLTYPSTRHCRIGLNISRLLVKSITFVWSIKIATSHGLNNLMVKWNQFGLPDPGTILIKDMVYLHDFAMIIGVFVLSFVLVGLVRVLTRSLGCRSIYAAHRIEMAWTIFPGIILLRLAIPSIRLLYQMDEICDPQLTVKAVGHQWYWSYEFGDFENFEFDSYPVPDSAYQYGDIRLLEVDKRLVLPYNTRIRIIITAADVIHSWAIPELGIKTDGIPGRLNQFELKIQRPGIYRGQCSELCGVNHAYIPIVVEAVPMDQFLKWAEEGATS